MLLQCDHSERPSGKALDGRTVMMWCKEPNSALAHHPHRSNTPPSSPSHRVLRRTGGQAFEAHFSSDPCDGSAGRAELMHQCGVCGGADCRATNHFNGSSSRPTSETVKSPSPTPPHRWEGPDPGSAAFPISDLERVEMSAAPNLPRKGGDWGPQRLVRASAPEKG